MATREQTYIMIKPDGVQRGIVGEIIKRFERKGFKLCALKLVQPSREHLEKHYEDLKNKKFFPGLITYMLSGPVVCMVWEGDGAVKTGRVMLGATKPSESVPGSIRGDLCIHVGRNICHGSDTVVSSQKEIALWFPEGLCAYHLHSESWIYENVVSPVAVASPSSAPQTFYITTAINYTNGNPHMGHAYEAITSDVVARYHRVFGRDVFFLTGADEHGQKIADAAAKRAKELNAVFTPQMNCDLWAGKFQDMNKRLKISNDFYIRTTSAKHKKLARAIFQRSLDNGDIYKKEYEGWYLTREERYVTDTEAQEWNFKDPVSGKPLTKMCEPSYFFKMSLYQKRLVDHIHAHPEFIQPAQFRNQILARLQEPLRDLSASRKKLKWGVPLPNDPEHVMYVWFDALTNYLSGVDFLEGPQKEQGKQWWPANVHVIGKDIIWFHCVIWPCILFSAGIELPRTVFAHGFVNDDKGQKMSKSIGNVVDPNVVLDRHCPDSFRWYLVRTTPYGNDLPFNEKALIDISNAELADALGNLACRVVVLTKKHCGGQVPDVEAEAIVDVVALRQSAEVAMQTFGLQKLCELAIGSVKSINQWLTEQAPWHVKGTDSASVAKRQSICRSCIDALYVSAHFLLPVIPDGATGIFKMLGTPPTYITKLSSKCDNLSPGTALGTKVILFKKISAGSEETKSGGKATTKKSKKKKAAPVPRIEQLEMKVGQITKVWVHSKSQKLFCEEINCGDENGCRQVASGLREFYSLGDLQGRRVVVVTNLQRRKFEGFESYGMVLCAWNADKTRCELVEPPEAAMIGERITFPKYPFGDTQPKKELSSTQVKKVWQKDVSLKLTCDDSGTALYDGCPLTTSAGACTARSICNGTLG